MEAIILIQLKAELGRRMIDLHTKKWQRTADIAEKPLLVGKYLIAEYTPNFRIPPVLQAKFWICKSMGLFAVGHKEKSEKFHDIVVVNLCQDPRFAGKLFELSRELEWARDSYLEEYKDRSECREKKSNGLIPHRHALMFGWRSLWEWLDLSK
jgi:hypothetical protein